MLSKCLLRWRGGKREAWLTSPGALQTVTGRPSPRSDKAVFSPGARGAGPQPPAGLPVGTARSRVRSEARPRAPGFHLTRSHDASHFSASGSKRKTQQLRAATPASRVPTLFCPLDRGSAALAAGLGTARARSCGRGAQRGPGRGRRFRERPPGACPAGCDRRT